MQAHQFGMPSAAPPSVISPVPCPAHPPPPPPPPPPAPAPAPPLDTHSPTQPTAAPAPLAPLPLPVVHTQPQPQPPLVAADRTPLHTHARPLDGGHDEGVGIGCGGVGGVDAIMERMGGLDVRGPLEAAAASLAPAAGGVSKGRHLHVEGEDSVEAMLLESRAAPSAGSPQPQVIPSEVRNTTQHSTAQRDPLSLSLSYVSYFSCPHVSFCVPCRHCPPSPRRPSLWQGPLPGPPYAKSKTSANPSHNRRPHRHTTSTCSSSSTELPTPYLPHLHPHHLLKQPQPQPRSILVLVLGRRAQQKVR